MDTVLGKVSLGLGILVSFFVSVSSNHISNDTAGTPRLLGFIIPGENGARPRLQLISGAQRFLGQGRRIAAAPLSRLRDIGVEGLPAAARSSLRSVPFNARSVVDAVRRVRPAAQSGTSRMGTGRPSSGSRRRSNVMLVRPPARTANAAGLTPDLLRQIRLALRRRSSARGSARGSTRGDAAGTARGDVQGVQRGDTRSNALGAAHNAARGGVRGTSSGTARGVTRGGVRGTSSGTSRGVARGGVRGATRGSARGVARGITRDVVRGDSRGAMRGDVRDTARGNARDVVRGATRVSPASSRRSSSNSSSSSASSSSTTRNVASSGSRGVARPVRPHTREELIAIIRSRMNAARAQSNLAGGPSRVDQAVLTVGVRPAATPEAVRMESGASSSSSSSSSSTQSDASSAILNRGQPARIADSSSSSSSSSSARAESTSTNADIGSVGSGVVGLVHKTGHPAVPIGTETIMAGPGVQMNPIIPSPSTIMDHPHPASMATQPALMVSRPMGRSSGLATGILSAVPTPQALPDLTFVQPEIGAMSSLPTGVLETGIRQEVQFQSGIDAGMLSAPTRAIETRIGTNRQFPSGIDVAMSSLPTGAMETGIGRELQFRSGIDAAAAGVVSAVSQIADRGTSVVAPAVVAPSPTIDAGPAFQVLNEVQPPTSFNTMGTNMIKGSSRGIHVDGVISLPVSGRVNIPSKFTATAGLVRPGEFTGSVDRTATGLMDRSAVLAATTGMDRPREFTVTGPVDRHRGFTTTGHMDKQRDFTAGVPVDKFLRDFTASGPVGMPTVPTSTGQVGRQRDFTAGGPVDKLLRNFTASGPVGMSIVPTAAGQAFTASGPENRARDFIATGPVDRTPVLTATEHVARQRDFTSAGHVDRHMDITASGPVDILQDFTAVVPSERPRAIAATVPVDRTSFPTATGHVDRQRDFTATRWADTSRDFAAAGPVDGPRDFTAAGTVNMVVPTEATSDRFRSSNTNMELGNTGSFNPGRRETGTMQTIVSINAAALPGISNAGVASEAAFSSPGIAPSSLSSDVSMGMYPNPTAASFTSSTKTGVVSAAGLSKGMVPAPNQPTGHISSSIHSTGVDWGLGSNTRMSGTQSTNSDIRLTNSFSSGMDNFGPSGTNVNTGLSAGFSTGHDQGAGISGHIGAVQPDTFVMANGGRRHFAAIPSVESMPSFGATSTGAIRAALPTARQPSRDRLPTELPVPLDSKVNSGSTKILTDMLSKQQGGATDTGAVLRAVVEDVIKNMLAKTLFRNNKVGLGPDIGDIARSVLETRVAALPTANNAPAVPALSLLTAPTSIKEQGLVTPRQFDSIHSHQVLGTIATSYPDVRTVPLPASTQAAPATVPPVYTPATSPTTTRHVSNLIASNTAPASGKPTQEYSALPKVPSTSANNVEFVSLHDSKGTLPQSKQTGIRTQTNPIVNSKDYIMSKLLTRIVGANITVMDVSSLKKLLDTYRSVATTTPLPTALSPIDRLVRDKVVARLISRLTGAGVAVVDKTKLHNLFNHHIHSVNQPTVVDGTAGKLQLFPKYNAAQGVAFVPTDPVVSEVKQPSMPLVISSIKSSQAISSNSTATSSVSMNTSITVSKNVTLSIAQNQTMHNLTISNTTLPPAHENSTAVPANATATTVMANSTATLDMMNSTATIAVTDMTTPYSGPTTMDPDAAADLLEAQEEAALLAAEAAEAAAAEAAPP